MRRFVQRLLAFVRSGKAEADLTREIDAHLQLLEDTYRARGLSADEARDAARRAFGGQVEQIKERQRDERSFRWLSGWSRDLRFGTRMAVRNPGLTLIAIFALSVAIGAGAGYFEFIHKLFRGTLPVPGGNRIVGIYNWDAARGRSDDESLHDFMAWRESLQSIDELGALRSVERNLAAPDGRLEPERGVEVSASTFRILRVPPHMGRPLSPDDERPGAAAVVVLGYRLWLARFDGDPAIVGRAVSIAGVPHVVVGVMPDGFTFPVNQSLWLPLKVDAAAVRPGDGPSIRIFGRLATGATIDAARAELAAVGRRSEIDFPDTHRHLRPTVEPFVVSLWASQSDGHLQMTLLDSANLLFLLLLVVCGANVATLVFARVVTREGEISVRSALGASRGRIVAQLFAEALVLAAMAAVLGLAGATIGLQAIRTAIVSAQATAPPFWWTDGLSIVSIAYALVLTLLTAIVVGVVPALKATGRHVQSHLKLAAAGTASLRFGGAWTGVIVTQVALTVLFLAALVSFGWNVRTGRYGRIDVAVPAGEYLSARLEHDDPDRSRAAFGALKQRLAAEPGVAGVTLASHLPGMLHSWLSIEVDGGSTRLTHEVRTAIVDSAFASTFPTAILVGRTLDSRDDAIGREVAVVDRTFARQVLGGRDAIGVRVREAAIERDEPGAWIEIVGVVDDLSVIEDEASRQPVLYRLGTPGAGAQTHVAVRVNGDPRALAPRLRAVAAAVDPGLRLYDVMPLADIGASEQVMVSVMVRVFAVLGVIALIFSTAGVYALMSFTVSRRTREIGIRIALGADRRQVVTGVMSRAMRQVALGVLGGLAPGSLLVAFGAPEIANGAGTTAGVVAGLALAGFMLLVGACASAVPLRRALGIQPTDALRVE